MPLWSFEGTPALYNPILGISVSNGIIEFKIIYKDTLKYVYLCYENDCLQLELKKKNM